VKRSVFVAPLFLVALAPGALAAEFSVKGNARETTDVSDNYFLTPMPLGYAGKTLSAIDLDFLAATTTTRYTLDSHYSYYKYFGPGAEDQQLNWGTPATVKYNVDYAYDPRTKFNYSAAWSRSDVATTTLTETGTSSGRGSVDTYRATVGGSYSATHADSFSWVANVSTVSYTDPTQTPYVDYATTGAWNHRISAATVLTQSVNFDWFQSDDIFKSQRLFWTAQSGFQSQISRRWFVNGEAGVSLVNAYQNNPIALLNIPTVITPGAAQGFVGDLGVTYKVDPTTVALLKLSKAVTPTVLGQLQNTESLGLTMTHTINRVANLTFLSQFSHAKSSADTSSDLFTTSVNLEYKLSREWKTSTSYTYRQRNDSAGVTRAHMVLVSLSRDFNVYGKPAPPLPKTQAEIIRQAQQRAEQALPSLTPGELPQLLPDDQTTPAGEPGQPVDQTDQNQPTQQ